MKCSLLVLLSCLPFSVSGLSLQSGAEDGGSSVAGGMSFDSFRNVLYMTGATTGSFFGNKDPSETNCFLGTISLSTHADSPWVATRQLGNADVAESCSALLKMQEADELFIAGASMEGGILSELRARGSLKATVYGMIMQLNLAATNAANAFALDGGSLLHEAHVQFPVSMDRDDNYIYVASIISEDVTENQYYEPFVPQDYGYGSQFSVKVQRFRQTDAFEGDDALQQTLLQSWQLELGTSSSVFVGGIKYMSGSSLILAGSTIGYDSAFPDATPGDDYDGFITEIDPSTGVLTSQSYRVESQPGRDDRIYNVCKREGDESFFYVVGETKGDLVDNSNTREPTSEAFIMKLGVVTSRGISMEWVRQLGASGGDGSNGVQGMACAVTGNGNDVYLVGRVDSGAAISNADVTSSGGTDVFIMQMDTATGNSNYIRQFGSSEDDYVADVVTDSNGNALVYGTTTGSFYRDNPEGEQGIFLLSVSRDTGAFDDPIQGGSTSPTVGGGGGPTSPTVGGGGGPSPTEPNATPSATPPPVASPTPQATGGGGAEPSEPETPGGGDVATADSQGDTGGDGGDNNRGAKIAISVIVLSVVALLGFFVYRRASRSKDFYSDEDHVVEYLKGFDDVEVDLKHSATGGWHGTYLNPRYQSSDNYSYNSETTETSIRFDGNNSYVRDSLFMDDYDAPSLGVHDDDEISDERENLTRQRSNYDGLLDAYNTTWDELSPHVMPATANTSTRSSGSKRDLSDKKHVMETIDFMKDDDAWGREII